MSAHHEDPNLVTPDSFGGSDYNDGLQGRVATTYEDFLCNSKPGETWIVSAPCPEHRHNPLIDLPFTREVGDIHPCRTGCVYERRAFAPPATDIVHASTAPWVARCGADYPNLRTTNVTENVTCEACPGSAADLRERWNDAQARMRDVAARVRPILGDVLLNDLAGATREMIAVAEQLVARRDADAKVISGQRAALEEYGRHMRDCGIWAGRWNVIDPQKKCTCGLAAAVAKTVAGEAMNTKKKTAKARRLTGVVLLCLAPTLLAQLHPMPGSAAEPPVICAGCTGNNVSGQPNAGLPTWPYSAPIKRHVGRYVDSTSTASFQAPFGFRTARARDIRTVPDQRGAAPPRIYIVIGSAIAAYPLDKFFTEKLPRGMTTVRNAKSGIAIGGFGRNPPEDILMWDGQIYPDNTSSGWFVPGQDKQDNIGTGGPVDVDDRGYVYAAYTYTGWGIVKDDGRTNGTHFPSVVQMLSDGGKGIAKTDTSGVGPDSIVAMKVGAKYYAVTASLGNREAVWDVTDPASPQLVRTRRAVTAGIRKWDRDDVRKRVAIVTGGRRLRVYDYAEYVGSATPIPVYENSAGFVDVSFDESGTLWAAESRDRIWRATPSTIGYATTSFTPHAGTFDHLIMHAAAGYVLVGGKARVAGGVAFDARLLKIEPNGLRNVDLNGFFMNYYHRAPAGFAQPAGYTSLEVQADLQIVPSGGKTYLLYSDGGLGDVFEIEASGAPVAPPPPPSPPPQPTPTPTPTTCTCTCPCVPR